MIDAILLDLRHSIRTFAKNPSFISVIVLTLAIGIGANTAMFSVIEGVLLRPLPFRDSAQLISLWTTMQRDRSSTAYPDFREIRDHNHSFTSIAAYTRRPINVTGKQDPERLRALVVSPEFLSVLGVQPRLGRDFVTREGDLGAAPVVIISDNMWKSSFASDRRILGRDINLDGVPHTIIGVLPPDFWFLDLTDQLIVPLNVSPGSNNRSTHFLSMIARLRPGVSREVAASELTGIANSIAQKTESNKGISFALASLQDEVVGNVRPAIVVLMIAVGFVLLIACGNLASLLLARSVARRKEIAVRTALGATPGILVRQFLTESIFLALLGGIAGILCSSFITGVVHSAGPSLLPRASQIHIDPAVLLFALMTSLLTGRLSELDRFFTPQRATSASP
jgi:predicted permease